MLRARTVVQVAVIGLTWATLVSASAPERPGGTATTEEILRFQGLLDARDSELQNLSFDEQLVETNIHADGSRQQMTRAEYEVRRVGERAWVRLRVQKPDVPDGPIVADVFANWDGTASKMLSTLTGADNSVLRTASIRPEQNDNFRSNAYNQLLGFRLYDVPRDITVAQWFRNVSKNSMPVRIADVSRGGRLMLEATVQAGGLQRTIALDKERNYSIARIGRDAQAGESHSWDWIEVTEAAKVSGVWIPVAAVGHGETTAVPGVATESRFSIKDVRIGGLSESDLDITFPPKTLVLDAVQNISYVMEGPGRYRLVPVADQNAHSVYMPPKNAVVSAPDGNAVRLYQKLPLIPSDLRGRARQWTALRLVIAALTIGLGVFVVAFAVSRRRKAITGGR